ncbi:iron-siderophore ABC transporter substrate-binding protein [Kineosporia babensis]|uniref:Iron-siderophore ABC transporter substrate-binding protein n=1 Tax=Kineosporia babensis TaxID=499548 RepID=A0A9X1SUL4_9ACTN|nr:iron-siderophore ABC transporter substrate-binding protein [Kineosporia babensis]MCD5311845.1 iron-siderophore ABC transporter substrate-binding protein [Kineosporia babensis]
MFRFRRPVVLAAAAVAAVLALSACGGGSSESSTAAAATGEGVFPVSLEHVYGKTEIPEKPQRIVTIGWMTHDIVAALGTAPVLVPETWGGDEEGHTPWFRDQVENVLKAEMPEVLNAGDDPDYEQILAAQPDLILAPHSGVTEVQYQRLKEIAPTVAYADKPWLSGGWRELTEVVATAMGEQEKGEELIAQTQSAIETASAKHENLKDASFAYTLSLGEGVTEAGFYVSDDPRVSFLRELGMVDSPTLTEALGDMDPDQFNGGVSLEKLDEVDADVVVGWSSSDADTKYTVEHPTFSRWKPIAEGNYYFIADTTMGMATSGPDPLSIPWAIEKGYVDDISKALDGGKVTISETGVGD